MRIHLAGSNVLTPYVLKHGGCRLHSILNERTGIERWTHPNPLMVDSGAHSWNKISINRLGGAHAGKLPDLRQHEQFYISFIERFRDQPWEFVELDCYGHLSQDHVDGVYQDVTSMGGAFTFLRVYHPVLDGGDLSVLKKWMDAGQTRIGVGMEAMPYFGDIFRLTRDKIKLHCFACTKMDVLNLYPFYSVDSTTALAPGRYGGALVGARYLGKETLLRNQSVDLVRSADEKIDRGVEQMVRAQGYFTDLWAKRGITWD